jgi:hypothetical protein
MGARGDDFFFPKNFSVLRQSRKASLWRIDFIKSAEGAGDSDFDQSSGSELVERYN